MITGILTALKLIGGPVVSTVTSYFTHKAKIAEVNRERELKIASGEVEWDIAQARASANSWKDEYVLLFLSIPFIIIFWGVMWDLPFLVERARDAFIMMEEVVPEYWWYMFGGVVAASVGIKSIATGVSSMMKKK